MERYSVHPRFLPVHPPGLPVRHPFGNQENTELLKNEKPFMKKLTLPKLPAAGLVLAFMTLLFSACQKMDVRPPRDTDKRTISQLVNSTPGFELLKAALSRTGLVDDLNKSGNFTVFAPTNEAFIAAGFRTTSDIAKADRNVLRNIILYHALGSRVPASAIPEANNTAVNTLQGSPIYATRSGSNVSINGVRVIRADINASNGVIHVINRVLIPASGNVLETVRANPNFSYLAAAVVRGSSSFIDLGNILAVGGPLTVFAPVNQAFIDAGFPTIESINNAPGSTVQAILLYHVIGSRVFSSQLSNGPVATQFNAQTVGINLAGPTVLGNGNGGQASNIITTDILATNGVIHAIDRVLLPNQ
jgi:uncharacterized surface protein with fasciclin (FAS1) repeats